MLYDPNWQKPKVADVFSLESLIAWLETMPADATYDYTSSDKCMVAQWLRSIDPEMELGPGDSYSYIIFGKNRDFREKFQPIASRGDNRNGHTFGAALARARKAAQAL